MLPMVAWQALSVVTCGIRRRVRCVRQDARPMCDECADGRGAPCGIHTVAATRFSGYIYIKEIRRA